jgi:hypothetical protein
MMRSPRRVTAPAPHSCAHEGCPHLQTGGGTGRLFGILEHPQREHGSLEHGFGGHLDCLASAGADLERFSLA